MFSFRTRTGYQTIDDDRPPQQFIASAQNDEALLLSTETTGEEIVSDVFGGPPLEHDIATGETGLLRERFLCDGGVRWDRVSNLDQFFLRVYEYLFASGYLCICLRNILSLLQFVFLICFATFLLTGINYNILFNDTKNTVGNSDTSGKIRIRDVIVEDWTENLNFQIYFLLLCSFLFFAFCVVRVIYQISEFYDIRCFYNIALEISDVSLTNLTWPEVVERICEKQPSMHLIISKDGITPLDIYQRILRYKNYFVALVNKNVLPPVINVPFFGPVPYLPNGLKMNLEWLLFYGQWSPWKGGYELREEYRHSQNLPKLASDMRRSIIIMVLFNLVFCPLIFFYQILYFFFSYGEMMKREPSVFAVRRYSNYGRNKLRHFNELDHELRLRLSHSHRAATLYMEQFNSPVAQVIAKFVRFIASAVLGVLIVLTVWDEDVITIEHVLTIMTAAGILIVACRPFIIDENMVYWPEALMNIVISHIHYAPASWKNKAHTDKVRKEFGQLFQLMGQFLIEELSSPLLTPFVLMFYIRPKAEEIVNFFHSFTVTVDGLGDVCSFAQMDIAKHGDPTWSSKEFPLEKFATNDARVSAEDGKTELSLLHFASNYPDWKPSPYSARFLSEFRNKMERDMAALREGATEENLLHSSLQSLQPFHQQMYVIRKEQSLGVSAYGADLLDSLTYSLGGRRQGRGNLDDTSRNMALNVTYMRNMMMQSDSLHNYGSVHSRNERRNSPVGRGDVWGVPAQSIITPEIAQIAVEVEQQSQSDTFRDQRSVNPEGLSDHLLDV